MHWIITADHINGKPGDTIPSRVGYKRGPTQWIAEYRAADPAKRNRMLEEFKAGMNFEFRLYDDDGILYYEGLCKDLDDQDEESAFGPLDWGMNDAGCTTMKYRKKGHAIWKTL